MKKFNTHLQKIFKSTAIYFSLIAFAGLVFCSAIGYGAPRTPEDLIEISCGEKNQSSLKILIAYDTIHGSTAEVAEFIGEDLCDRGYQADVRFVANVPDSSLYDAVIIGSGIYQTNWLPDALEYINQNYEALTRVPTALFIVCAAMSEDTPESRESARQNFVDPLLAQYPDLEPVSIGPFGGAVDFNTNQYNTFEKIVLRILGLILGYKDSADWRNWEAISDWTAGLDAQLAEEE